MYFHTLRVSKCSPSNIQLNCHVKLYFLPYFNLIFSASSCYNTVHLFFKKLNMETFKKNVNISADCIEKYSDKKLHAMCRKYGTETLLWRQAFIGLLPEVNRRRLYEKRGYGSIFEFGQRMAGLSESHIRLALNLEKRFADKPALKNALVEGEISINKLTRVASIATTKNEKILVEVFVKDMKRFRNEGGEIDENSVDFNNQNGLFGLQIESKSLHVQSTDEKKKLQLNISEYTLNHLLELQESGIDIDEIVRLGLKKRKGNLEHEKMEIGREEFRKAKGKKTSRRMSVKIKTVLEKEFGTKCAVPGCRRDKDHIHHTLPFSLIRSNDPRFLIPLCKEHHDVVHIVNEKVWEYKS